MNRAEDKPLFVISFNNNNKYLFNFILEHLVFLYQIE